MCKAITIIAITTTNINTVMIHQLKAHDELGRCRASLLQSSLLCASLSDLTLTPVGAAPCAQCHSFTAIRVQQHSMKEQTVCFAHLLNSMYNKGRLTTTAAWHDRTALHLPHLIPVCDWQKCCVLVRPFRHAQDRLL